MRVPTFDEESAPTLTPWLLWTGGDAPTLAPWVVGDDARIVPDLVLQGLARIAHGRVDR